ncbi:MAG: hypothetical protein JWP03_5330 [Phycisphaerales bacterium]|nr:hypothetical protein [Phycisphaerales bacterium]
MPALPHSPLPFGCTFTKSLLALALCAAPWFAAPADLRAADAPPAAQDDGAARHRAIDAGLKRLAELQKASEAKPADAQVIGRTATVALEGLAYFAAGSDIDRGPYGKELHRCLDFIVAGARPTGLLTSDSQAPMYGHGLSLLFLSEAYARATDPVARTLLRDKLAGAIALTAKAQTKEGCWRYLPTPYDGDSSVTACQLVALCAARNAGMDVDHGMIDRAAEYLWTCQNDDGGFNYMPKFGGSAFARSAAALAALSASGPADDKAAALGRARDYLAKTLAILSDPKKRAATDFRLYGSRYAADFLMRAPDDYRARHLPELLASVLATQQKDGRWQGDVNDELSTAQALLTLQIPEGRLKSASPRAR